MPVGEMAAATPGFSLAEPAKAETNSSGGRLDRIEDSGRADGRLGKKGAAPMGVGLPVRFRPKPSGEETLPA